MILANAARIRGARQLRALETESYGAAGAGGGLTLLRSRFERAASSKGSTASQRLVHARSEEVHQPRECETRRHCGNHDVRAERAFPKAVPNFLRHIYPDHKNKCVFYWLADGLHNASRSGVLVFLRWLLTSVKKNGVTN